MRVSSAKTAQRVERNVYLTSKYVKSYGKNNDYPQKVLEIIDASGTGKSCIDQLVKFVAGNGFLDKTFNDSIINNDGERVGGLLRKCARDIKYFKGFAILIKYDLVGTPVEYYNVPFEQCRLGIDTSKNYNGKVVVHPDWTGISGRSYYDFTIKIVNKYNPNTVQDEIIEAGGPANYLGQILYFTSDGDWEYPICPYDPVITDMLTEDSVSTVKHRNAKFNFLPAGILVRKGIKPVLDDNGEIDMNDPANKRNIESANMITKMQGDENASKIWVVDVDADEERPEFIEFAAKNYDRQFELTEKTIQENIGKMFMIPPILRGVDVGAGFGADLMTNAYNFMNSITGEERQMIQDTFKDIFIDYSIKFADFTIEPLKYILQ